MAIVRWDPFAGLTSMHSQLDDMFNTFLAAAPRGQNMPSMDVYTENDKALVAEIQAPGFTKDDIEINIHDGALEIKGEKQDQEEQGNKKERNYMVRESHASFYRSIVLPKAADTENVEAQFDNGVLKLRVPFKELPPPKRVKIAEGQKKQLK